MLLCRVLCGCTKDVGQEIKRDMRRLDLPPDKYDSVKAGPHQPTQAGPGPDESIMYVIYHAAQVYLGKATGHDP